VRLGVQDNEYAFSSSEGARVKLKPSKQVLCLFFPMDEYMSKRPWFPLYVGDMLADTMNFDSAQFGGYMKILCHYWMTEEPMSIDEMRVASGLSKNIFQKSWPLFSKKFVTENEKYFNRRMKEEITKAIELSEKRSKAGSKGGQANAQANDEQLPTQLQSQLHKEHSVNKLTGDDSPEIDQKEAPKKELTFWDIGESIGIPRPLIGKACKNHTETAVAEAIAKTQIKSPADPRAFFSGLLKANPKTGSDPTWLPAADDQLEDFAVKQGIHTRGNAPQNLRNMTEYRNWLKSQLRSKAA
jgi:uncharacterized protein YdaU (DUF1376 family)